jgi:hypothetical protein
VDMLDAECSVWKLRHGRSRCPVSASRKMLSLKALRVCGELIRDAAEELSAGQRHDSVVAIPVNGAVARPTRPRQARPWRDAKKEWRRGRGP